MSTRSQKSEADGAPRRPYALPLRRGAGGPLVASRSVWGRRMRGNVLLLSLITLLPIGVGCDGATTLKVEGGAASGVASAGHCGTILASSYDQSCTAGTDCVPEPDGDFCCRSEQMHELPDRRGQCESPGSVRSGPSQQDLGARHLPVPLNPRSGLQSGQVRALITIRGHASPARRPASGQSTPCPSFRRLSRISHG